MFLPDQQTLEALAEREAALAARVHLAQAEDAFLSRLDMLLPAEHISTAKFAFGGGMLVPGPTRQAATLQVEKSPYVPGIMDAMDLPGVGTVAVKGPSRATKTISGEAKLLKILKFGPIMNILMFMQSKDDLTAYVDERFAWYMENIEEIAAKIDPSDSRNSRTRYDVGGALVQLFPATQSSLRGKSGLYIFADEIDAYAKAVRGGILTLIKNRQVELGAAAFAYLCSHPDAGPIEGIDAVIASGLRHLWAMRCPMRECRGTSSFAKEAEELDGLPRMTWNVSSLLKRQEEMERQELFDMIQHEARLICPHCGSALPEDARLEMSAGGVWLQPRQQLLPTGEVKGAPHVASTMGFVIHGMMSTFRDLGKLARQWAVAKVAADTTGSDTDLREVEVKSLGQTYGGSQMGHQIDSPKIVFARLIAGYEMRTVPARVLFLTAFVDVQGDRFEVVVIGWNLASESWLIDRFALKQWEGFENIDPANRVTDWAIIEKAVLAQSYALQQNPDLFMPIAKVMVNNAGGAGDMSGGVTNNGRIWWSNMMARGSTIDGKPIEQYRVTLFQGSRSKTGERYGKARKVLHDERGTALQTPAFERTLNVHEIKMMIASRMQVEQGPGRMHLPAKLNMRYVNELVAERLYNDEWVATGRNETWDGWVACEAARALLQPDREGLWENGPPPWAEPRLRGQELGSEIRNDMGYFDRLARLNLGE